MNKGELVPDEVICEIIKRRLEQPDCEKGFILDGVPRTFEQAKAIKSANILIDHVVMIDVSDEEIVRRMSGRRTCGTCGDTYHIDDKPPKKEGICDTCGIELSIRKDDAPETVLQRLKTYHETTEPLIDYYKDIFIKIPNQGSVEDNTVMVLEALHLK
jgi:adenylate kinase